MQDKSVHLLKEEFQRTTYVKVFEIKNIRSSWNQKYVTFGDICF